METNHVKIFFDESGKNNERPTTMGALLIPDLVYENKIIQSINKKLQNEEFKLHWKNYGGHNEKKKIIIEVMSSIMKFYSMFSFNIINYKKPNEKNLDKNLYQDMVYTKLPERIFYGLLRHHGIDISIDASVFIEVATEYKSRNLKESIAKQLNMQAMYRGENYKISNCSYKSKNKEIGVEVVDLILGVIRTIILNESTSNTKKAKRDLVIELLKDENFYSFLSNINYFEWSSDNELKKINFKSYIQSFLSKQKVWINYLVQK